MTFEEFEKVVIESVEELPQEIRLTLSKNSIKIIPREKVPPALKEKFLHQLPYTAFLSEYLLANSMNIQSSLRA